MEKVNFIPSVDVVTERERLELNSKVSSDNLEIARTNLETAKTVLEQVRTNRDAQRDAIEGGALKSIDKYKVLLWCTIGIEVLQFVMHIIETYF